MNKITFLLILIFGLILHSNISAQTNVGISSGTGTFTPNATAILDISSATLGLLIPRMATAPTLAVSAQGLLFYNTTGTGFFNVNTSSTTTPNWIPLVSGATTNTLASSANTLTSTVNTVAPTAAIINSLTDAYATNAIITTANGKGSTAPAIIINTNVLSSSGATLSSTINGATAVGSLDLTAAVTSVLWALSGGNAIATAAPAPTTYGTTAATNSFLGTSSSQDLVLVADKLERLRIANASGNVGIGLTAPLSTLEVVGTIGNNLLLSNLNASTITPDNTASIYYITSKNMTITLPSASSCTNRKYLFVNVYTSGNGTGDTPAMTTTYTNLSGNAIALMPAHSSVELISDGTTWRQIY